MTPRRRLLAVLRGEVPDCVPVMPDFSNMIPVRLTGKPFWDVYLYDDPPRWQAYIDAADYFDIDSLMDGHVPFRWPSDPAPEPVERFIVFRSDERIITQESRVEGGKRVWAPTVTVYYVDNPPMAGVGPAKVHLPLVPKRFEPVEGVKPMAEGVELLRQAKRRMGDRGLAGVFMVSTCVVVKEEGVYRLYDEPQYYERLAAERMEMVERRFVDLMTMDQADRPDFICVGGSGTLIWQTAETFRKYALPAVKRAIDLCSGVGIPTHVHSCGPEKELVRIFAEETDLTVIDPLEVPPMGDCDLAELKRRYGGKIVLKGNLHTTDVMLRGSVQDVIDASKKAIDDAAAGGRFILSTGDQCGRDTPDENLRAMVETARTYGRY